MSDMREYTHLASGIMLGLFVCKQPYSIALTALGAVMPDIDSPFSGISKISNNKKSVNKLIKHRGIMHTLTAAAMIYAAYFAIFKNNAILPFIWGYCLHIFLDAFTPMGVRPFVPVSKVKIRLGGGAVKTGSISDKALGFVFFAVSLIIIYIRLTNKVQ